MALPTNRWPIYVGGFLLGLACVMILMSVKRALAPKFHEKEDVRAELTLGKNGSIRLVFQGDPERRLVHGFPSALYVAKEAENERWKPILRLEYKQLLTRENLLGPWAETGRYEIRMGLYICRAPGDANCLKRIVVQPFTVEEGGPSSAELVVDLDADLPENPNEKP